MEEKVGEGKEGKREGEGVRGGGISRQILEVSQCERKAAGVE